MSMEIANSGNKGRRCRPPHLQWNTGDRRFRAPSSRDTRMSREEPPHPARIATQRKSGKMRAVRLEHLADSGGEYGIRSWLPIRAELTRKRLAPDDRDQCAQFAPLIDASSRPDPKLFPKASARGDAESEKARSVEDARPARPSREEKARGDAAR